MTALQYVLAIVIILVSIAIIALVMLQEGKQQGLGAIAGASEANLSALVCRACR